MASRTKSNCLSVTSPPFIPYSEPRIEVSIHSAVGNLEFDLGQKITLYSAPRYSSVCPYLTAPIAFHFGPHGSAPESPA